MCSILRFAAFHIWIGRLGLECGSKLSVCTMDAFHDKTEWMIRPAAVSEKVIEVSIDIRMSTQLMCYRLTAWSSGVRVQHKGSDKMTTKNVWKRPVTQKWKKVRYNIIYSDLHQKLIGSILCREPMSTQVEVVFVSACSQSNQPTNEHGWKYNLFDRGNKQENILSFETANIVVFMLLTICSREIWY